MSVHIPGPWYFDPDDGAYVTDGPESRPFQHNICQVMGDWSRPEIQANGRLLAAAPELLEALKAIIENDRIGASAAYEKGAQAIAKAEGRQS